MRRPAILFLVLSTLLLIGVGVLMLLQQENQTQIAGTPAPASLADVPRVSVEALRGQLATSNPPLVWELRTATAFAQGHVPGSRVMTLDAIPEGAAGLDKRTPIVILCA